MSCRTIALVERPIVRAMIEVVRVSEIVNGTDPTGVTAISHAWSGRLSNSIIIHGYYHRQLRQLHQLPYVGATPSEGCLQRCTTGLTPAAFLQRPDA